LIETPLRNGAGDFKEIAVEYPVHPLSEIFPLMTEHEYEALKSDIDKNGL
jgi:hypothetical protein